MQPLILSKKILATSLLVSSFAFADNIGDITEHKGSGGIVRESGEVLATDLGVDVMQMDAIETAKGRIKLTFLDDTVLRLVENTEVVLTTYYFDPNNPKDNSMSMKFVSGTARFATGKLGLVPRENIVHGIQQHHLTKWNWVCDEKQRINYPDYQWRIWKNKPEIKWVNKVHEKLDGYKKFATLPAEEILSLYHHKDIKRQEKQNEYYDTLS